MLYKLPECERVCSGICNWKGRGERRENFGYKKYPECFYNKSIQDIFYLVFIDMTNELNLLLYRICVNDTHLNSLIFIG